MNKKSIKAVSLKHIELLIPQKAQIICLCGQMAAGKNYVAKQLCKIGECVSLDLDLTVHTAIKNATPAILKEFSSLAQKAGLNLQNKDGSLNRRALGALVFSSPELLKKQEQLVYPETIRLTKEFIQQNAAKTVLLNATVLYKTPELLELCSKIYFVKAFFLKRLIRAKKRDKLPLLQILKRFKSQNSLLEEYKKSGIPLTFIKN